MPPRFLVHDAGRPALRRRVLTPLLALFLWTTLPDAPARSQILLIDGDAVVAISPSTTTAQGNINMVWRGIDHANQLWWWYRIDGDSRETRLPPPDSQSSTANTAELLWTNVDGRGFDFELELAVYDCNISAASCGVQDDVMAFVVIRRLINKSGSELGCALFEYVDLDVNGAPGDTATVQVGLGDDIYRIEDGPREVTWATFPGSNVQAADYPLLRAELDDTGVDDLTMDLHGLPYGPGDVTLAAEILAAPPNGSTYSFQTTLLVRGPLFADGFESGDTAAWTP